MLRVDRKLGCRRVRGGTRRHRSAVLTSRPRSESDIPEAWTLRELVRQLSPSAASVRAGYWTGEPGNVRLDPWPYTEIYSILTGRVAVVGRLEFGAGRRITMVRRG